METISKQPNAGTGRVGPLRSKAEARTRMPITKQREHPKAADAEGCMTDETLQDCQQQDLKDGIIHFK